MDLPELGEIAKGVHPKEIRVVVPKLSHVVPSGSGPHLLHHYMAIRCVVWKVIPKWLKLCQPKRCWCGHEMIE